MAIIETIDNLNTLPLIIPAQCGSFIKETLKITGYLDRAMFLDNGVYEFKKLHLCSQIANELETYPETIKWLRSKFIKDCSPLTKRRIYVTRKNASSRNITNELELQPILTEYGFEIIDPCQYTIEEQVKIFQEAEILVGPHGAGLTNTVFGTKGAVVISIYRDFPMMTYYMISILVGMSFGFLRGTRPMAREAAI